MDTVATTAANVSDVTQIHALLHGREKTVFGDAGYTDAAKREELKDKRVDRAGPAQGQSAAGRKNEAYDRVGRTPEGQGSRSVGHPFRVIKQQVGFWKARYRWLTKNNAQLHTLFALSNLWMVRRRILANEGELRL